MYRRAKMWMALIVSACLSSSADADLVIDWSQPSVSINIIDSQNAIVTGFTTGDQAVAFQALITTANASQQVTLTGPLGGIGNPLNLNIPAPRQLASLMAVEISIPGYQMVNSAFELLDVDAASQNSPPFGSWQDQITFLDPVSGITFTPVDPARYSINGNQITAVLGPNIGNNSPDANVNVQLAGASEYIRYTYGPGLFDLLGQNQRHGISNITIQSIVAIPEPGVANLMFFAFVGLSVSRRRKRHRLSSNS